MKNLLNIYSLDQRTLLTLIDRSIEHSFKKSVCTLKNKRVALLFSEVSLRTKISFEIATQLLGGISTIVSVPSLTKEFDGTPREVFLDILKSLESWVDALAIRDYSGKILKTSLEYSKLPIIDCFCGENHPTQTIADLGIIKKETGKIKGVKICCVCPPFGSGVMESFAFGAIIMGAEVNFLTPKGKYDPKNKEFLVKINKLQDKWKGKFKITENKKDALDHSKFLYVDEWWKNKKNFLDTKLDKFKVDDIFLQNAPKNIKIMHYLPAHHNREISKDVLHSANSIVFKQAEFRLYSAMASLEYIFKT